MSAFQLTFLQQVKRKIQMTSMCCVSAFFKSSYFLMNFKAADCNFCRSSTFDRRPKNIALQQPIHCCSNSVSQSYKKSKKSFLLSRNVHASHCCRCCASQTTEHDGQPSEQRHLPDDAKISLA